MSVGIIPDKGAIDNTSGSLCRDLNNLFGRIVAFDAWLDGQPDADLISAYGYSQADVDRLKSAFSDLAQLQTIYTGAANLANAKDFRTFAKLLAGFNLP